MTTCQFGVFSAQLTIHIVPQRNSSQWPWPSGRSLWFGQRQRQSLVPWWRFLPLFPESSKMEVVRQEMLDISGIFRDFHDQVVGISRIWVVGGSNFVASSYLRWSQLITCDITMFGIQDWIRVLMVQVFVCTGRDNFSIFHCWSKTCYTQDGTDLDIDPSLSPW